MNTVRGFSEHTKEWKTTATTPKMNFLIEPNNCEPLEILDYRSFNVTRLRDSGSSTMKKSTVQPKCRVLRVYARVLLARDREKKFFIASKSRVVCTAAIPHRMLTVLRKRR